MFKNIKKSNQFNIRIILPRIICLMILTLSIILCGCNNSSSVDEESFEEEYAAAQKKYEKYLNEPVSGQEVLDLIENWDETFDMTIEDLEGKRYSVSDLDKYSDIIRYWDRESIYYIDPDALYKGGFFFGSSTGREKEERWWIRALNFSLVEDPSLSEDNTTENDD